MSGYRYHRPTSLPSLSIVLPAYNEELNVRRTVQQALESANKITSSFEIIVVNDGSKDKTAEIVSRMAQKDPIHIRLVNNPKNLGYGPTIRHGLASARKDWVFFTDADGQFDLAELKLLVPYSDHYDFVIGRRKNRRDPINRKVNAGIFNFAVKVFFGIRVKDVDCAFKLMRRSKLSSLDLTSESAMINTELLHKAQKSGITVKEIDITHLERAYGEATGANKAVVIKAMREFYTLRFQLLKEPKTLLRFNSFIIFYLALIAGISSALWAWHNGTILAFGDAEAHLNIAKRVFSSLTPGLAQLGGVWLPLPHLLMAPLTISNYLWRTGLAGSILSVAAFVWLCVIAYRLAFELTGRFAASYLAPLALILNPNLLYLAATPMTETLLLSMASSTIYYFAKWVKHDRLMDLVISALFAFATTISRYDGWAVVCMEVTFLGIILALRRQPWKKIEGSALTFGFVAFLGILGWLAWNYVIFKSPFYFANSVYGSKQQQMFFLAHGYLPTYHDWLLSIAYFADDIVYVVGFPLIILSCVGLAVLTASLIKARKYVLLTIIALALFAIPFYVLSLYLGQASLILPNFAKSGAEYTLSNSRYGVQILLAVGLFVAAIGAKYRKTIPLILLVLFAQTGVMIYNNTVIVYNDATAGLSSQKVSKGPDAPAVETYLRDHYSGGLVLMDDYRPPVGIVESGIPMNNLIGSGNKPYWQDSLDSPGEYAKWIVVQKASTDAVWSGIKNKQSLNDHFVNVFTHGNTYVYTARSNASAFVAKSGQHLTYAGKTYTIIGVNSYDLLTQPRSIIKQRLAGASADGFNTIRIWCFNKSGTLTSSEFASLDYALSQGQAYHLKFICVLGNTLSDYGGPQDFGATNSSDFFSNPAVINKYMAEALNVVNHVNARTNLRLADDPTILAWELINEPRIEGQPNFQAVTNWVETIGQALASSDVNHLISPGTEGFTSSYPGMAYNENHGASINDVCALDVVTLCSAHLYPKYLNGQINSSTINELFNRWRILTEKLNKPMYVGEVGYDMSSAGASEQSRTSFFNEVGNSISSNSLDGAIIWNLSSQSDNSFSLSFEDQSSQMILKEWEPSIKKSN